MDKARVLQVVTDNDRRGAQVFATDLQVGLAELGWQVRTVALTSGDVGGLDIEALGTTRRSPATIGRLRARARQADVVVAHGSTTLPITALAAAALPRPFVYRQISDSLFWAPSRMRRARVRAALKRAAGIVALWSGAADVLLDHFGVPAWKVHVVPNGAWGTDWRLPSSGEREAARRRLGLPVDRTVVAFVGALSEEKGPDLAVEVVADTPEAHLLVVGAGPYEGRVQALAKDAIDERVTFLGSTRSMWDVYAATDVLLFPSRGGDSMPATVIEAGLMGVPTVATNVGALGCMIESDVTGLVATSPDRTILASALRRLVSDPDERVEMGYAARQRFVERFDMKTVSRQWAEVLEGVIR